MLDVLQVGVGGFGRRWREVLAEAPEVTVAGVVDTNASNLEAARAELGLAAGVCHGSLDEALAELRPDVVVCVTPPESHREVVETALAAGAHVIVEKPLADSMEDAEAMAAAADRAGRRLAVSQNYRYRAEAITVRELLASGRAGRPGSLTVRFARGPLFEGSFRRRMAHPLVHDMSIHHYDLMRALTGLDPVWTFASAHNPEWSWYDGDASVSQVIGFEGDLIAAYSATWCSRGQETSWNGEWRLECSEAVVTWDGRGVRISSGPGAGEDVPPAAPKSEGQAAVLAEFVAAVAEGREPETSARDNLKSLAMVFGTIESSEAGAVVRL